jgi:C-terminal processing protease CtpA/Prc
MKAKAVIAGVLALASAACSDNILGPPPSTDHTSVFEDIWKEFDLHYSFFQLKNIDWNAIGAKYRPQAAAAKSDVELAVVVSNMLAELKDPHVSLTAFGPGSTMRYVSPYDTAATYYNAATTVGRYVTTPSVTRGGHIRYGRVSADMGYAVIESFLGDGWAGEMDEVLDKLNGVSSMVVDVRNNNGGNRTLAIDIAGRFTDRTKTFGYIKIRNGPGHGDFSDYIASEVSPRGPRQFTGPVYVLSNRHDFSSAEDFILAMRGTGRAKIVGDTTAGVTGGPIVRELANGWTYELSQWIEFTADKKPFEGIGLAPDIVVKSNATLMRAGTDPTLESARSLAVSSPGR